jgi:hypothetical protein
MHVMGYAPSQPLRAPLRGHLWQGGVRVAVSADGRQTAFSGAVAACGAAWPGRTRMGKGADPTGVDPPDPALTTLTRTYMLFSSNNY